MLIYRLFDLKLALFPLWTVFFVSCVILQICILLVHWFCHLQYAFKNEVMIIHKYNLLIINLK